MRTRIHACLPAAVRSHCNAESALRARHRQIHSLPHATCVRRAYLLTDPGGSFLMQQTPSRPTPLLICPKALHVGSLSGHHHGHQRFRATTYRRLRSVRKGRRYQACFRTAYQIPYRLRPKAHTCSSCTSQSNSACSCTWQRVEHQARSSLTSLWAGGLRGVCASLTSFRSAPSGRW